MFICKYKTFVIKKDGSGQNIEEKEFKSSTYGNICGTIAKWNTLGSMDNKSGLIYCYGILEVRKATFQEWDDKNIPKHDIPNNPYLNMKNT